MADVNKLIKMVEDANYKIGQRNALLEMVLKTVNEKHISSTLSSSIKAILKS